MLLGLLTTVAGGILFWVFGPENPQLVCLAKNVYFEARLEPELGQRLVAHVTLERQRENSLRFGRPAICNVVYHKTTRNSGRTTAQFSWTLLPKAQQVPQDKRKWEQALRIAREARDGSFVPEERFRKVKWYLNTKASERRNICWFKSTLVSVEAVGDHEFFREPTNDSERLGLLSLNPEECHPPKKKKSRAKK